MATYDTCSGKKSNKTPDLDSWALTFMNEIEENEFVCKHDNNGTLTKYIKKAKTWDDVAKICKTETDIHIFIFNMRDIILRINGLTTPIFSID